MEVNEFNSLFFNTLSENLLSEKNKEIVLLGDFNMMMNCFRGMVDRRKAMSLISSQDNCQRSSPSQISDEPWAGFETAQNLSSGLVEWSFAVVITTTPQHHILKYEKDHDLLKYEKDHNTADFLDQMYSTSLVPHITSPTQITSHSRTLIDSIFSMGISENAISGFNINRWSFSPISISANWSI